MSLLPWIVLGLIAGFIGSKIVNKRGEGLVFDIILVVIRAVVGGWVGLLGYGGVSGLNLYKPGCHGGRIRDSAGRVSRDPAGVGPTARASRALLGQRMRYA
jgi:uncharacterized membrane protein YeaQ/YmgE (transglycosylase-associated protein family)